MAGEPAFNETIHAPLRLRICGLLRSVDQLDFAVLRDTLGTNDVTLSKQLKVLGEASFVAYRKTASPSRTDARRITWLSLTRAGEGAFDAHLAALSAMAGGVFTRSTGAVDGERVTGT